MAKRNLFDLFKEYEKQTIEDPEGGDPFEYAFRALDYHENQTLLEAIEKERNDAQKRVATDENRKNIEMQIAEWTVERVIKEILGLERGAAESNADLAPGVEEKVKGLSAEEAEKVRKEAEQAAMKKWEEERGADLKGTDEGVLRKMLVERQIRALITLQTNAKFLETAIIKMMVDVETKQPLLSTEPKDPNFVGRLMPRTREIIVDQWQEFMAKSNEKRLRAAAKDPRFLASGSSPRKQDDTPGATTETPSGSPPASSPSTASVDG
jgi:hypothetical protein